MSHIAVTGATGTIGRALVELLLEQGDEVHALTRDPERARATLGEGASLHAWPDPQNAMPPLDALRDAEAVVHLLGEPVAQRWSEAAKRRIRDSRVGSTRQLVRALSSLAEGERAGVLVCQSAAGYYGPSDDRELREDAPPGSDFLAGVVVEWEREAYAAEAQLRVATTRTGVVLSPSGGALAKMLPPFRLGVGGPVAGGRQYVPWIHLEDVTRALRFCVGEQRASGPLNLVSPQPVTNADLSRALGRVLHRPAVAPVPGLALRALYGEMATIVTTGQRAVPARLEELGFEFRHPELEPALRDVLQRG